MDDEAAAAAGGAEHAGHDGAHGGVRDADELVSGAGGVGERPEIVEDRRHAELTLHCTGPTKRMARWKALGEAEAHARRRTLCGRTPPRPRASELDRHAEQPRARRRSRRRTTAARLPMCLHTYTPAPAVMSEASVVTLMLARRSPPVPTRVDDDGVVGQARAGTAPAGVDHGPGQPRDLLGRLALARAAGSRKFAPIWAGVASPLKITTPIVASAWLGGRATRARESVASTDGQVMPAELGPGSVPPQVTRVQDAPGDRARAAPATFPRRS